MRIAAYGAALLVCSAICATIIYAPQSRSALVLGLMIFGGAGVFALDQLVVAPEAWGLGVAEALLAQARRLSPSGLDLHVNQDNARAIRFYEKHGFVVTGADLNPRSGAPLHKMSWRPHPPN